MALTKSTKPIPSEKLDELELIECFQRPTKGTETPREQNIAVVSLEQSDSPYSVIMSLIHTLTQIPELTAGNDLCKHRLDVVKTAEDVHRLPGCSHGPVGKEYCARFMYGLLVPLMAAWLIYISFLYQRNSFSPLDISRQTMNTIMMEHNVCAEFLITASSFCAKAYDVEDSLCLPFRMRRSKDFLGMQKIQ